MRRHAKATSSGPNARKPSGHGASPPSGRLRLFFLAATAAALLLVPAAQALAANQTLTVTKTGAGSGTITSEPAGISCPGTCSAEFEEGAKVKLSRTVSNGSEWEGWSGCTEQDSEFHCYVTMSAAKEVTATFDLRTYGGTLKLNITGSGSNKITSEKGFGRIGLSEGSYEGSPAIECSGPPATGVCESKMEVVGEGQGIFMEAIPQSGYMITSWAIEEGEVGFACEAAAPPSERNFCFVVAETGKNAKLTANFALAEKLTVTKSGTGTGEVTSSPAGIECGETCSKEFGEGTEVTLTAKATTGATTASTFSGWSGGGCSGTGTCVVTMSEAKSVNAEFTLKPKFKLTVTKSGTGTVTSSPSGLISCGATCSAEISEGTAVTLTATATTGATTASTFAGWSGAGCSGTSTCKVTMSAAKEVNAEFKLKPKFKLTVTKSGPGSGTVKSSPSGLIECGATCSAEISEGTAVTLTATAAAGSKFAGWSGSGCSGTSTCKVTMSAAKEVNAEFSLEPHLLTVTKSGSGSGTVTSSPAGISCGATCSASFPHGTEVTLSASPASGSVFAGWSGACSGSGECKVTMSEAKSVGAEFIFAPKQPLTVTKTGAGSGTVTSSPAGISCGGTCSAEFEEGSKVTLSQSAAAGSEFREWSGACSGAGACEVTMTEAKSVNARFSIERPLLTVKQEGTGTGTVSSKPNGIKCATACSLAEAAFYKGTVVVLKAKAATGSTLASWSGCEVETNNGIEGTCTVTMSAAKEVKVTYGGTKKAILNPKVLTLAKATGSGQGTAKATGITCEAACTATEVSYTGGDGGKKLPATVTLLQTPAFGSAFSGWSGCESEPEVEGKKQCVVLMSAAHSVSAQFTALPNKALTVKQEGSGVGTVSSKPKGIKCATACSSAIAALPEGAVVVLKAKAATGSTLASWSGCEVETNNGIEGTCTVTMSAAKEVKVSYGGTKKAILNPVTLTLNKAGTGYGTAKATGITCEAACTQTKVSYTSGDGGKKLPATVTLVETPQAGSQLTKWEGCESEPEVEGKKQCVVSMSAAKEVTATFDE